MKNETLNYNLLNSKTDKFLYIILMNISSMFFTIIIIWLYFFIGDNILYYFKLDSTIEAYINIIIIIICIFIFMLFLGLTLLKSFIGVLGYIIVLLILWLSIWLLDKYFNIDFQFGAFLILFGFLVMILPYILLISCRINFTLFIWNFIIINILTFGINILGYGGFGK
ncbi:hypothetical protein CQA53_11440 [Helicobacter didelphidarum]|uniref:Uncharacterized protein n=1 Tax=Helicobacter didelphidarum TaxID=2040648 RepID=A0A3D8I2U9_9HELI|nr:hypothetical protein CQA53_11440 [Helicobacter didelphidarum]